MDPQKPKKSLRNDTALPNDEDQDQRTLTRELLERAHAEAQEKATVATGAAREFQRRMKHAAFEHRERKLAVQALQARIQREIQFLTATAADLEKRVSVYVQAFSREFP
ncbi:hypothetical protein BBJ28_00006634 [Nothophytophthora sp. Chile5]|nr:hypothetical protein BBJ28_00006634 [Nothophytophthora sp. Chile5]